MILKSLLPDYVKLDKTIDHVRLRSSLNTNKTTMFTEKTFFYTILGITQSHSGPLGNIEESFEFIPGSHKSNKPININGIDKNYSKCDCINGGILDGGRQPILYSFALDKSTGYKKYRSLNKLTF